MTALLSFDPSLRRPLLDLMVSMARVDPMIAAPQLAAVRGAQVALGMVDAGDAVLCASTGQWWALALASDRERSLAYAAARWIALADGVIDDAEASMLATLQRELGLHDAAVRLAESIANGVACRVRTEGLPPHRAFTEIVVLTARHAARRRALRAA